jgi:hypothetical protein
MISLPKLATAFQTLFTTTAEQLARQCGFIQRQRKLSASEFVRILTFGWIADPKATLDSFAPALNISASALSQRCNLLGIELFKLLLHAALSHRLAANPNRLSLLRRFSAVIAEDSTQVQLPADLAHTYPACGGSSGSAGLKILLRWDLLNGRLDHLSYHPATATDVQLADAAAALPKNSLHLADLGFFSAARRRKLTQQGVWWITRLKAGLHVRVGEGDWVLLTQWLKNLKADEFDGQIEVVKSDPLSCRVVAVRLSADAAGLRRRRLIARYKKKGKEPSAAQLVLCDWQVLATNLPKEEGYDMEGLSALYRCRWQVELLVRRSKQHQGWETSHGKTGERVLMEVLAKMLGSVVVLWGVLMRGGPLCGVGHDRMYRVVRRMTGVLAEAVRQTAQAVQKVLLDLHRQLQRVTPQPKGGAKPTTRKTLQPQRLRPLT